MHTFQLQVNLYGVIKLHTICTGAFCVIETFEELKIIDTKGTNISVSLSSVITGLSHLLTHADFICNKFLQRSVLDRLEGRTLSPSKKIEEKVTERKGRQMQEKRKVKRKMKENEKRKGGEEVERREPIANKLLKYQNQLDLNCWQNARKQDFPNH